MSLTGGTKSLATSVTFWGALLAIAAPFLSRIGIVADASLAPDIASLIGGVVAIYGRLRATQRVTITGE